MFTYLIKIESCSFHVGLKPSAVQVRTTLSFNDIDTNGRTFEPFIAVNVHNFHYNFQLIVEKNFLHLFVTERLLLRLEVSVSSFL